MRPLFWAPDGRGLLSVGMDSIVRIWWPGKSLEPIILAGPPNYVWFAAWSPDGRSVAIERDGETVHIWDAMTGALRVVLPVASHELQGAVWSPDGTRLLTVGDGGVHVWDSSTGGELRLFRIESGYDVEAAIWSPDGRSILTTSRFGTARIWELVDIQLPQGPAALLARACALLLHTAYLRDVAETCAPYLSNESSQVEVDRR